MVAYFSLFLLASSYSKSETVTTENLLGDSTDQNINDVATSNNAYGMTGAEFTTGNQSQGGGSKTFDIDLSEYDNIDVIEYGSSVYSHISNQSVPTCANTTRDCKDEFKISVNLYNDGVLTKQYTHNYTDISWVGKQDFDYQQDVSSLVFNTAELELYGIDRGYYNGYFGIGFSDYYFTTTYEIIEIVIDQVLDQIEMEVIDAGYEVYEDISFEIEIQDPQGEVALIEFDMVEPEMVDIEIETPSMEDFEPIEEIQTDMEVVEVDMTEMAEELEVEVEPNSEDADEPTVETEEEEQQETVQPKSKEEVAQKIIARVVDQGNQIVLNNVKLAVMAQLADTDGFNKYQQVTLTDMDISDYSMMQINDSYGILFESAQNEMMEDMINAQY